MAQLGTPIADSDDAKIRSWAFRSNQLSQFSSLARGQVGRVHGTGGKGVIYGSSHRLAAETLAESVASQISN